MRIYNKYIVILALAAAVLNALLAFFGQKDIEVYFALNVIAFLTITLLFVQLNPRARMALNGISALLFGGFVVIIVLKVMEFLSGK